MPDSCLNAGPPGVGATSVAPARTLRHLLIIRHGETDANRNGIVQGHTQTDLNALGQIQAARLAERLAGFRPRIEAVLCSDLNRAMQTARPVADRLGVSITIDPAWRERCYGQFEGLNVEQRSARKHELDEHGTPPGGQCRPTYQRQVFDALQSAIRRFRDVHCLAIVTHGGASGAIMTMLGDGRLRRHSSCRGDDIAITHQAPNCSVTHLTLHGNAWAEPTFSIECMHDVAHLDADRVTRADHG